MFKVEIDVQNWITLYEKCIDIKLLKPQISKDYYCFKTKEANPVKLGQTDKFVTYIPKDLAYFKFFENNKLFWMIPLELPDQTIIGFILKGFNKKEYRTVIFTEYSVFFGLYNFNTYKRNNLLILTEGSKDCLYMKTLYPYSLALNTSKLTLVTIEIIKALTNKVLLIYDWDSVGNIQKDLNKQQLQKYGIKVFNINYGMGLKDPGDFFTASLTQKEAFQYEVQKIIQICNR